MNTNSNTTTVTTSISKKEVQDYIRNKISEYTYGEMQCVIESSTYDDYISPSKILEAFNSYLKSLEKKNMSFKPYLYNYIFDYLLDCYDDYEYDMINDIRKEIEKNLWNNPSDELLIAVGNYLNEEDEGDIYDKFYECGYEGMDIDVESFFNQDCEINLLFATKQEENSDMVSIRNCFTEYSSANDYETYKEDADNALTYLIHQQGYTISDVLNNNNSNSQTPFCKSVRREILEDSYMTLCGITALISANGKDLINLLDAIANKKDYIELSKNTVIGLFNSFHGSGSLLEIELEKPAVFPTAMISDIQFENSTTKRKYDYYGYTVNEVYGFCDSQWKGEVKIITEPPILQTEDLEKTYNELIAIANNEDEE